jgi:hypothetical protein
VLDASPRILRLAFTELDPLKICDFGRCGVPNAADFRVRVDTLRWELGIIDIPPHETVVYTANETGKVYLELLNYTVTYQEKVFVSYTPFPDNACEPTAGSDPNRVCKLTYPDDTACGGRTCPSQARRFSDPSGNTALGFQGKVMRNWVNPEPRIALVSDLRHDYLQIYFTGSGTNEGTPHVDDWTLWMEERERGEILGRGPAGVEIPILDAFVRKDPKFGALWLKLPRDVLNGEVFAVRYIKSTVNASRHVRGNDGLTVNSFSYLRVENNVWPTLVHAVVREDNASLITMQFTGRGIANGFAENEAFSVILEDCRACTAGWHTPKRKFVTPVITVRTGVTPPENENGLEGYINISLPVVVKHFHVVKLVYASRFDERAPYRWAVDAPEAGATIFADDRFLPVRNFTGFVAQNEVLEVLGYPLLRFLDYRESGYSQVSEPVLAVNWQRTNKSAQFVSLLVVTPLGKAMPPLASENNTFNGSISGDNYLGANWCGDPDRVMGATRGRYVYSWQSIPGCVDTTVVGCQNNTHYVATPRMPGDYRLQLWNIRNNTIGTYSEMMRRSFGEESDAPRLRTSEIIETCGGGNDASVWTSIVGDGTEQNDPNTDGTLPKIDLGLMEVVYDLPLHVQYTVNIDVPGFSPRVAGTVGNTGSRSAYTGLGSIKNSSHRIEDATVGGGRRSVRRAETASMPVHVLVREGDPVYKYNVVVSTSPAHVSAASQGILVQVIDTCSRRVVRNSLTRIGLRDSELERLHMNGDYATLRPFFLTPKLTPSRHWTTTRVKYGVYPMEMRTLNNVMQDGALNCSVRHILAPADGNFSSWDVALVLGSRDRIEWSRHNGTAPVIDLEVRLHDDESGWLFHETAHTLGMSFAAIMLLAFGIRLSASIYWRTFDAYDLRDLNNSGGQKCLEVPVAGTRHPAALLASDRYYASSCFWTALGILQSFAVIGRLRLVRDRATIFAAFCDGAFGTLTGTASWMVVPDWAWSLSSAWRPPLSRAIVNRSIVFKQEPPQSDDYDVLSHSSSPVWQKAGGGGGGAWDPNHGFPSLPLLDGQEREYDIAWRGARFLSNATLATLCLGLAVVLWSLFVASVHFCTRLRIRHLQNVRDRSRPKAMTSGAIVEATKATTTAQALRKLRRELFKLSEFEKYHEDDLRAKRKKNALKLWTPEGMDYVKTFRIHDVLRRASVLLVVFFVLFQGMCLASASVSMGWVLEMSIGADASSHPVVTQEVGTHGNDTGIGSSTNSDTDGGSDDVVALDTLVYTAAAGTLCLLVLLQLGFVVYFAIFVPRATTYKRISVETSLVESTAIKHHTEEMMLAALAVSNRRGRWYVAKADRHMLRRCGVILFSFVRHGYSDADDGVKLGGAIVNKMVTEDEVQLRETERYLCRRLAWMWPAYRLGFQLVSSCVVGALVEVDKTGINQAAALAVLYAVHTCAAFMIWPMNIRRANLFLSYGCVLRTLLLLVSLFLAQGHGARMTAEVIMCAVMMAVVLPPALGELNCSYRQMAYFLRCIVEWCERPREDKGGDVKTCCGVAQPAWLVNFLRKNGPVVRCQTRSRSCCIWCRGKVCCCLVDYLGGDAVEEASDEDSDEEWVDDGGNDERTVAKRKRRRQKLAAQKAAEDSEKDASQLENERIDRSMVEPKEELARLREELEKMGYSVKARPMLGHV